MPNSLIIQHLSHFNSFKSLTENNETYKINYETSFDPRHKNLTNNMLILNLSPYKRQR